MKLKGSSPFDQKVSTRWSKYEILPEKMKILTEIWKSHVGQCWTLLLEILPCMILGQRGYQRIGILSCDVKIELPTQVVML